MYMNPNKALPKPTLSLYTSNTEIHNHNTRYKRDAHITSRRSQLVSRSFIHRSPEIWLQITGNIKSSKTMNSFKNQIKRYMDLNILGDWFRANKLSLNINKTTYMVFQNKREQPNRNMTINIGTESIKRETAVKFIGFHNWRSTSLDQ